MPLVFAGTSRLALNLFLTQAGLTRIIIPTVFRDDYISALKALSSNAHPMPLVRMLTRAARFSRCLITAPPVEMEAETARGRDTNAVALNPITVRPAAFLPKMQP
jgi:hypothetical protein